MSDFKCPYPDCPRDDFKSQNAVSVHHVQKHGESLAKKETNCENCDNGFNYYPSQKEGILCDSCIDDESVDIFDFRDSGGNIDTDYIERECPNCETINTVTEYEAEGNDRTFCGKECYFEYRKESSLVDTNCDNCGDDMTIKKDRYEESENNYCSDECQWDSMRKKTTIECANCGQKKEEYPSQVERVDKSFCSDKCRIEYKGKSSRVEVKCQRCSTKFDKLKCEVKRTETHFCTRDCRHEYYSSEDFDHDSYGRGFFQMKNKVRERDDYECQICGRDEDDIGRCPSVHHITPVEWFIESNEYRKRDSHYPENGILLCPKHHGEVEYGIIDLEKHIDDELAEKLELENPVKD